MSTGITVHRRQTTNRYQCTTGTCDFYSHCIESQFPCGHEGLVLSYAKKRCETIKNLRLQGRKCSSSSPCVSSAAYRWAQRVEYCFQVKLQKMLEQYQKEGQLHDPQVCLEWERKAFLEFNKCYSSFSIMLHQLSDNDIKIIVANYRIGGEYYDTAVDRGLPLVVKSRNSVLAAQLVKKPPMDRFIFCIKANRYTSGGEEALTLDNYVQSVRDAVDRDHALPLSDFHYGGMDEAHDDQPCTKYQPSGINSNTGGFHLVTLFMVNGSTRAELKRSTRGALEQANFTIVYAVYELTSPESDCIKPPRNVTECGDGQRQATEECDYGGSDSKGCSIDCHVQEEYDCGTARLQPSMCWLERCGDGARTRGEECDDGNSEDEDGCDSSCHIENTTHACTQAYNVPSTCTTLPSLQSAKAQQVAPLKHRQSSITSRQAPNPPFSSRAVAAAREPSKRTVQSPLAAVSAGSRSLSISLLVLCVLALLVTSLR